MTSTDGEGGGGWEARYRAGDTPWDLGGPPPCLVDLLARLAAPAQRVLVPGAGYGHDAFAWARAGHEVTAVDIAPSAVRNARRLAREQAAQLEILQADLLDLPDGLRGRFDIVWEQTCFCALQPDQRPAYVASVHGALRPDGVLHGLFWQHGKAGGPPFDITPALALQVFGPCFVLEASEPVVAAAAGRRNEFLMRLRRR